TTEPDWTAGTPWDWSCESEAGRLEDMARRVDGEGNEPQAPERPGAGSPPSCVGRRRPGPRGAARREAKAARRTSRASMASTGEANPCRSRRAEDTLRKPPGAQQMSPPPGGPQPPTTGRP